MTQRIDNEFHDAFTGIGCFDGTFRLQVREDSQPYQAPPSRVADGFQEPLKKELEWL